MPLLMPRITRVSPDALNISCWWFSSDTLLVQESPRESIFKDRYFESGIDATKQFKDPAQIVYKEINIISIMLMKFD